MGLTDGIIAMGSYDGTLNANFEELLALLGDPDELVTNARNAGSNLDEMSPMARAQLVVEIEAFLAAQAGSGIADIAFGEHTITAGEATANQVDIVTGLDDLTLSRCAISVWNGTTLATSDAVITEPSAGTIRVADGSTYNTVAGYVIRWMARKVAA